MCSALYNRSMNTEQIAADLADVFPNHIVTLTPEGWVDIHVHPDTDFVRVVREDNVYRILTLTRSGVVRGEAALSGSTTGLLVAVVREILEAM